jgi:phospholipid/cholesterol/gamma-HCH transport system substrate-binding protein
VAGLFSDVKQVSDLGTAILDQNGDNIIREGQLSQPVLALLEKYAPEYNCLLRGVARYKPVLLKTFAGGRVKQYIEFPGPQVRSYGPQDKPVYADRRGPRCVGLPDNPTMPWPGYPTANGTDLDTARGRGNSYFPPQGYTRASMFDLGSGDAGLSATSLAAYKAAISRDTGQDAASVSDLSAFMYAGSHLWSRSAS